MSSSLVYRRHGGSIQVDIPNFDTLAQVIHIPETQWIATACPIEGLQCDPRFLALMDSDGNGRIRVAEVRAAVEHTAKLLQSRKGADAGSDVLELSALSPEGARLQSAARRILTTLKAESTERISLQQVRDSEKVLREAGINGDGIIAPAFLPESVRGLASRIMAAFSEVKNRAGQAGVDPATLQRFREARTALLEHLAKKDAVHVWGEASLERAQRIHAVRPLLEGYFLQCRLVAAQPEAASSLKLTAGRVESALGDTAALEKAASVLPIAPVDPAGVLTWARLYRGPAFEALEAFRQQVAVPLTGSAEQLTDAAWRELTAKAEAVLAWQAGLDASPVKGMAAELATLADADLIAIEEVSKADLALKDELDAITELERLVLYQRWLLKFANNFISMPDLYSARKRALYERGTLVLGGRRYTLSVLAQPRAPHAALTSQGTTCILYVRVAPKDGADGYEVAVPVTRGNSTGLEVGKRGIFHDVEGKEYDAIVTQVVRHPVSLWEAMTMPFQRIGRFITSKVEALATAGDKDFEQSLEQSYKRSTAVVTTAVATSTAPGSAPAPAPAPAQVGGLGGLIAAGGIAFAAVGSSLAFIVSQVKSLTLVDVISAALIIAAIVMLPAGLLGWLKLRKRNLALLLEGSGWALNDRLMLTRELAALITRKPRLPKGARIDRTDALITALPRVRSEEEEEDEDGTPGRVKLVVGLLIALVLLWQARMPMARYACGKQWLSLSTCTALLPGYLVPPEALAPPAPAAAAPAPVAPVAPAPTPPAP
ncbi:MAG TPA: kinesin [Myxococcaceae bacterium]|nr:kinesin [Myxococcaceae bacterium]